MIKITYYVYVWDYGNKYYQGLFSTPDNKDLNMTTIKRMKSTSKIVITDKHIEVYDNDGKLRVRINKE